MPPDSDAPDNGSHDRTAIAAYIADLSTDLALIARSHGLETLGYILEMARLEAETMAHRRDLDS
jgi:hypothetical protein